MNGAHVHLLLNHFPILGSLFALCLLLYGIIIKSNSVIKAALLAMIVSSLFAIPTYLSGEDAEHVVDPVIGINDAALEEHEDASEFAFWGILMSGAIALGTLVGSRKSRPVPKTLLWVNVVMMIWVFSMMARTGLLGGQIRHTEIEVASPSSPGIGNHED